MGTMGSAQIIIESLLAAGKKLRAIVRLADATGASFHQARAAIEHYEDAGGWRPWHRTAMETGSWRDAIANAGDEGLAPDPQAVVEQALRDGQRNQAIQHFADLAGINMFAAKRAVDHYLSFGLWLPQDLASLDDDGRASPAPRESAQGPAAWDPETTAAVAWLALHLAGGDRSPRSFEAEWVVPVDALSARAYLIMLSDRGCVVCRGSSYAWRLAEEFLLRDVDEATLREGVHGTALHLCVNFVRTRISFPSPADAADVLELIEARAVAD